MKAILEYELPEERVEFGLAWKGHAAAIAIDDFSNFLRLRYKHVDFPNEGIEKEFTAIRDKWYEILAERET